MTTESITFKEPGTVYGSTQKTFLDITPITLKVKGHFFSDANVFRVEELSDSDNTTLFFNNRMLTPNGEKPYEENELLNKINVKKLIIFADGDPNFQSIKSLQGTVLTKIPGYSKPKVQTPSQQQVSTVSPNVKPESTSLNVPPESNEQIKGLFAETDEKLLEQQEAEQPNDLFGPPQVREKLDVSSFPQNFGGTRRHRARERINKFNTRRSKKWRQ